MAKKTPIFDDIRHRHSQRCPVRNMAPPHYYGAQYPPGFPISSYEHEMVKKRSSFGGNYHDPYGHAHAYRVHTPPPVHRYSKRVHFEDQVVTINEDMPHGTSFFRDENPRKDSNEAFFDTSEASDSAETSADNGSKKDPKRPSTKEIFGFFSKKKKQN